MFSRFTEKAIQAIMLAQEEAKRFHHSYVGTEHILLGIIGEADNVVVKSLYEMGYTSDQITNATEERLEYGGITSDYGNIPFTQQAKQVLTYAWDEARKLGHNYVNVEHLFLSVFRDPTSIAARVLAELGIEVSTFKNTLFKHLGDKVNVQQKTKTSVPTPTLDLFGRDLTWLARENKLDPVVGRKDEIERIIQILCRRTKNNPVLTGEPGVGKTAIIEGLAQKICSDTIPDKLKDKRVITLDLGLLVAGTKYRGEFEDRVKKVMEEARKAGNVIIFVDELHTIIGTGGSEGSLDAANLFKPALARGELQCIGATTLEEYRKHIEGDGALERRFQSVLVEEPSMDETIQILRGIRERYEEFHNVTITDESLIEAVNLSNRYITERFLPDKAVDVIDEAAAKIMLKASSLPIETKQLMQEQEKLEAEVAIAKQKEDAEMQKMLKSQLTAIRKKVNKLPEEQRILASPTVDENVIAEIVSAWTKVPITKINSEETQRLITMDKEIEKHIIGQKDAVKALVRAVKRAKVGLKDPKRPTGSFLFLGPTGVGKSELAKRLAENLFGSIDNMIRIDMSEYMEKHTVSRLIGSPPGYVGFNEGGQLSEPVRRKPYSVILFDELEKASPDILNILLQILEDGRLTDSSGRVVNFKNTIVIMTSNIGSKHIHQETSFGFVDPTRVEEKKYDAIKAKLQQELKESFKPEFLNRIDDIIIFKALNKENMYDIADVMLLDIKERLEEQGIILQYDKKVKELIVSQGYDQKLGARPLRRSIQTHFEDALADALLLEDIKTNIIAKATVKNDVIQFTISPEKPAKKTKKQSKGKPKELVSVK
ncbi:MAG: ATP-dependent Clp protease ATP-binding subunit ClpC [Rickettsiales bacterium]|nr:ATP-dependent Clp protease ATP-binding subunit ClpC [Rickettsiales bacterium]|tara:strand:+ start:43080 stop:45563 length:2484 start_codon:yes stop_codon:yes gene_type:complete